MAAADLLALLDVDPAQLDPAPAWAPHRGTGSDRLRAGHSCAGCGQPARVASILDLPDYGLRWLDRCRTCFLATKHLTPHRMPSTMLGILADLHAAAAEAGVRVTVATDDDQPA